MEMPTIQSNTGSAGLQDHSIQSIGLYILSWLFIYFETLSVNDIWTWTWRSLSAISLLLIIYINWNKVIEIWKKKKKKK